MMSSVEFLWSQKSVGNRTFVNSTSRHAANATFLEQHRDSVQVWFFVTTPMVLLGIIFNVIFLATLYRHPSLRTGAWSLIAHIAAINLITCLIHCPIYLLIVFLNSLGQDLPKNICNQTRYLYGYTFYVGFWSEATLGFNRVFALCFPMKYNEWVGQRALRLLLILPYLIALMFIIPTITRGTHVMAPSGSCILKMSPETASLPTVAVLVPYSIVGAAAVMITIRLRKRLISTFNGRRSGSISQRRIMSSRILVFWFLWGSVAVLPINVISGFYPAALAADQMLPLWLQTVIMSTFVLSPVSTKNNLKN